MTIIRSVDGGHTFSLRIKGYFGNTGHTRLQVLFPDPLFFSGNIKGCFSRVTDEVSLTVFFRVVAQRKGLQQPVHFLEVGITGAKNLSIHIDFFHSHLVKRQGPCLIGTDISNRSESFNSGKLSHQGVLFHHLFRAKRKRNGDNGRQGLRYCRHGKRDSGEKHEKRFLPSEDTHAEYDSADNKHYNG